MPFLPDLLAHLGEASAPAALPVHSLRDGELLDAQRAVAAARRRLDAVAASIAGEIAHRSRRELGHSGLAQSHGQRTAEGLISQLTGGSAREARTLVKAGELLPLDGPRVQNAPREAWLAVIGDAVATASISVEAAGIIRDRLGAAIAPRDGAAAATRARFADARERAAARLVSEAPGIALEQLGVRASQARDDLDAAGVAEREREQHERRFLRFTPQADGMVRVHGLLDRESAAIMIPVLDAATSPRRGGPRFVDPHAAPNAEDLVRDERTPEQLTADVFVELIRAGARVDSGRLLGDRKPAVRILVTKRDLERAPEADGQRPASRTSKVRRSPSRSPPPSG